MVLFRIRCCSPGEARSIIVCVEVIFSYQYERVLGRLGTRLLSTLQTQDRVGMVDDSASSSFRLGNSEHPEGVENLDLRPLRHSDD